MAALPRLFLGVDGGASSTKAVIGDGTGRILSRATGAPCDRATPGEGEARLEAMARELVERALEAAGQTAGSGFEAACFGMSGGAADKRAILAAVARTDRIEVINDAEAALEGATCGGPGVVVIAGTGSIALARDVAGNMVRSGGWGYVFGDEGGAFDIVRRALREALAAEEGWGAPTSLRRMLLRETGARSVNEALHRFYDPDGPRDRIASLAPGVDRAAGKGDPAAVRVMRVSGEALGTLALQAVQALPAASENPAVHPCGGVFGSVAVRNAFAARVRSGGCSLADPVHDAATGALLRAYRTRGLEVTVGGPV